MQIEIACDESGFSGTNMLEPGGEVFAHAAVRLDLASARRAVDLVRGAVSGEYKSHRLLRTAQRPELEWLLGPDGPLAGRARVHLTDKRYFTSARVVDVLVRKPSYTDRTSLDADLEARTLALDLHRKGAATYGRDRWHAFLAAFELLMRAKRRRYRVRSVEAFLAAVDGLGSQPSTLAETLARYPRARLERLVARLHEDPTVLPPLEPLMPALVEAGLYWSRSGPVSIVHDEQSALTRHRVAEIRKVAPGLHAVRMADSRTDPRVQVADLLAGAARRIATAELAGRGDAGLTALLRPYLDPHSIWADDDSWSRLAEGPPA